MGRYDVGLRFGEKIDKDVIAGTCRPYVRSALVASPACFTGRAVPKNPKDLANNRCINYRLATLTALIKAVRARAT